MKLEKAIEILIDFLQDPVLIVRPDTTKSIKLGIEALEHQLTCPYFEYQATDELPSGETKD